MYETESVVLSISHELRKNNHNELLNTENKMTTHVLELTDLDLYHQQALLGTDDCLQC